MKDAPPAAAAPQGEPEEDDPMAAFAAKFNADQKAMEEEIERLRRSEAALAVQLETETLKGRIAECDGIAAWLISRRRDTFTEGELLEMLEQRQNDSRRLCEERALSALKQRGER